MWAKLRNRSALSGIHGGTWRALAASQQKEMNDALVMLHEAVAKEHQAASRCTEAMERRMRAVN